MSNNNDQLKFSELSVDMFRMVHMLEYQQEIFKSCPDDPSRMRTCENPQKCLLFQPDISKFMLFISGAYDEVGVDGALFVYLSAVGVESIDLESHPDGLKMSAGECLFYTDLITFTRKPLFLIVESDRSASFNSLPMSRYGQPIMCILAPSKVAVMSDFSSSSGSWFTLFLYNPLLAVACLKTSRFTLSGKECEAMNSIIENVEHSITSLFQEYFDDLPNAFRAYLHDPFTLRILVRTVMCKVVMSVHYPGIISMQPLINPQPPHGILSNDSLLDKIYGLLQKLDSIN